MGIIKGSLIEYDFLKQYAAALISSLPLDAYVYILCNYYDGRLPNINIIFIFIIKSDIYSHAGNQHHAGKSKALIL
ncbi:hypothetical protein MSLAZ_2723 [Methanosarcina lacustris Z-7289]|uniref:Uncharacterized protein n=1 Tax=Methanosarcina lacustris Z-7289 TaxID=1434111 RepID=A0A0E3S4J8_9EURY|nr:hypothetical protein [Methanosarcina lacustris]AKB75984.1 hypothetical protein MSLAZ_2723 [Methanosarcina lacustris Z-7289]